MSDNLLISRKALEAELENALYMTDSTKAAVRAIIRKVPAVDAAPVVHGRWEPCYETFDEDPSLGIPGGDVQTGWHCSVCGRYEPDMEPYCNCGAKMDGGGSDD